MTRRRDDEQHYEQHDTSYGLVGDSSRTESFIERGADDLVQRIAPNAVRFDETYFRLGDQFCRVIYLSGWPVDVEANWLRDIFGFDRALDVSVYYQPLPVKPLLNKLRSKAAKETAEIEKDSYEGNQPDYERLQRLEDAEELLNMLQRGETKPFQVSLQILIRADSLRELNDLTRRIEKIFDSQSATTRCAEMRQRDAWLSVMPFGRNYIADAYSSRNMHTQAAMYSFPLANADLTHPTGVWYGVNRMTNSNVILDRFKLQSPHTLVLGASGSGKSYGAKLTMLRELMLGYGVIVVDPEAECVRLAEMVGGQFITIGPNSPDRINALDFSAVADGIEDQLTPQIQSVLRLIGSMMNPDGQGFGLNAEQVQLLEMLLRSMYADFRYTQDPRTQLPPEQGGYCTKEAMPILSDLRARIQRYVDDNEHDSRIGGLLKPILAAIGPYCAGGMFASLFDQRTTVDLRAQMVVFNIRALTRDQHLMSLGMHTVLNFIWNTVMNRQQMLSGKPRVLYVDEAHVMMRSRDSAEFLENLVRRARKFFCGVTLLTQSPEDFVRPDRPEGRAIFDNTSMQVIMRLKRRALEVLQDILGLDDHEVDFLSTRETGEGMIFAMNDRVWVSMRTAAPREHEMITTNPEEVAAIEARRVAVLEAGDPPPARTPVAELPAAGQTGMPVEPRRPQIQPPPPISQIAGTQRRVDNPLERGGPPKPLAPPPGPSVAPDAPWANPGPGRPGATPPSDPSDRTRRRG